MKRQKAIKWRYLIIPAVLILTITLSVFSGCGTVKPKQENQSYGGLMIAYAETSDEVQLSDASNDAKYGTYDYVKITTPGYDGDLEVSYEFTGEPVYWGEEPSDSANTYVTAEPDTDNRTYKITCKYPFGQQIAVKFKRPDTGDGAVCVCDCRERFSLAGVFINGYFFDKEGKLLRGARADDGLSPVLLIPNSIRPVNYGLYYRPSSPYTVPSPEPKGGSSSISFKFTVRDEWVSLFGFETYDFQSYEGTIGSGGEMPFFDAAWCYNAVKANGKTRDEFLSDLWNAEVEYDDPLYGYRLAFADGVPAYTLTLSGGDGKTLAEYNLYLDLFKVAELVGN